MADKEDQGSVSLPTQNVHQGESPRFPPSAPIQARVVFGEVTYFALTSQQIDTYAALGWLITACVTLVGILLEAFFGCWLAIEQGGLSPTSSATINIVKWVTGVSGLIIAVFAIVFWCLRAKGKRGWLTNTVQLEQ